MTTKCNSMEINGQKQRPCKLHQNTVCDKYTLSPAAPPAGWGDSLPDSPGPKGPSKPAVNAKIRRQTPTPHTLKYAKYSDMISDVVDNLKKEAVNSIQLMTDTRNRECPSERSQIGSTL